MNTFKKNARHSVGKLCNISRPSEDKNTNVLWGSWVARLVERDSEI